MSVSKDAHIGKIYFSEIKVRDKGLNLYLTLKKQTIVVMSVNTQLISKILELEQIGSIKIDFMLQYKHSPFLS